MVGGAFVPGRSGNALWGTRSPAKLKAKGIDAEPHYDKGKHLYWRALDRYGRKTAQLLELRDLPYPKPEHGEEPARQIKRSGRPSPKQRPTVIEQGTLF